MSREDEVQVPPPAKRRPVWFLIVIVVLSGVLAIQFVVLRKLTRSAVVNLSPGGAFLSAPGAGPGAGAQELHMAYVGPTPTDAPSSWVLAPGECLAAALQQVDAAPATKITPDQASKIHQIFGGKPDLRLKPEAVALKEAAQAVLTPTQVSSIGGNQKTILNGPFDLEAFIQGLQKRANAPDSKPAPASPGPASPVAGLTASTAMEILLGLNFLEQSNDVAITPAQARLLLPAALKFVGFLRTREALFSSVAGVLTPDQRRAFVAALVAFRKGQTVSDAMKNSRNTLRHSLEAREAR